MAFGPNKLIAACLPRLPKVLVGQFARRYVAGETVDQALITAANVNDRGFLAALDILGEHVQSTEEASLVTAAYAHLYQQLAGAGIRANISLKLTHLGLGLGRNICRANLLKVVDAARVANNFLRIDMENSPYTDDTLDLYRTCREIYPNVGLALQAYLLRSQNDLAGLLSPQLNVRLCKGIYREPAEIALQDRGKISQNYLELLGQALDGGAYVAIATHDRQLIAAALALIAQLNCPADRFEFQALYGVPMQGMLETLLERGLKVRIYLPFGEGWHPYAMRRLKENPHIVGYVLRDLWRK